MRQSSSPALHCVSTLAMIVIAFGTCWPLCAADYSGTWETSLGRLVLQQDGLRIKGQCDFEGESCCLRGELREAKIWVTCHKSAGTLEAWLQLADNGRALVGQYRDAGSDDWREWKGSLVQPESPGNFDGLWETTFGRMRLIQQQDKLEGIYAFGGGSKLTGTVNARQAELTYRESDVEGEATFELAEDGRSFRGRWHEKGKEPWQEWVGRRVDPAPGRSYLVVLENRWEENLIRREYSFGEMLRAFFARAPHVEVRTRGFQDVADLRLWCSELAYLAEPCVLVVASHGTPQGPSAGGKVIDATTIGESLRYARNLRLLHFSSCLVMAENVACGIQQASFPVQFPVSGYASSVDWALSAVIEFLYLDLVLVRDQTPATAAEQLPKLLLLAGDQSVEGVSIPPARFRIVLPPKESTGP